MAKYTRITVPAAPYIDEDDCLAAAAADYASTHDLEEWQVTAVGWADAQPTAGDEIVLEVPAQ